VFEHLARGGATGTDLISLTYGKNDSGIDVTWYGDTNLAYMMWDASGDDFILSGPAAIQTAQTGSGYSFNLISVTMDTGSGNLRGLRVNLTSSASITVGDMQCVHGYLTLGATNTLATNAAVYPLSAWLDLPSVTTGTGNLIAGLRVIVDVNNQDLSSLAGGGESALIYAQKWSDTGGDLEHGLRLVCGGGTGSIKNMISMAATGSATIGQLFDFTEGPQFQKLATFATADAQTRKVNFYIGDSTTRATVWAEVSAVDGTGSLYFSSAGKIYIRTGNAGASTDWERVTSSAAD
jgi:hypothetical protein